MYHHSDNVRFNTPSGYTEENIECDPSNMYLILDHNCISIEQSVTEISGDLPCKGVTFGCNGTGTCDITYINKSDLIDINSFQPFFNCYGPLYLQDLFDLQCIGTCPESPSIAPTTAPSWSPSKETTSPIAAPTFSPSISSSNAPSKPPTASPTTSPSWNPTSSPSFSPSLAPSFSPSSDPTYSPSLAPSTSPTSSPLAVSEFDSFIDITYILARLTQTGKTRLAQYAANETEVIQSVINEKYFIPNIISYDKYMVQLLDIEGTLIEEIGENEAIEWITLEELKLHAQIECNQDDNNVNYCESIKLQSQSDVSKSVDDFSGSVQKALAFHYSNADLQFYVDEPQALDIVCKICETEAPNYVLYGLLSLVSILCIISIFAFLYNKGKFPKLPGFYEVDNARWTSITIFAVQFWYVFMFFVLVEVIELFTKTIQGFLLRSELII